MKSKVRLNAMKDAAVLSKDQQRMQARMRHKHGVTIKANPPVYDPTDRVEHEQPSQRQDGDPQNKINRSCSGPDKSSLLGSEKEG
jgi:hypothetical protein